MLRKSAKLMKTTRAPTIYTATEGGVAKEHKEDFDKITFLPYTPNGFANTQIMKENIKSRVIALLGYRNEIAYNFDMNAKVARAQIQFDELVLMVESSLAQTLP